MNFHQIGTDILGSLRIVLRSGSTNTRVRRHRKLLSAEQLEDRIVLNAQPVLDPAASPELEPVRADAGAPEGNVGTLVSTLIDAGGPHNNYSDADGDLPGIAIVDVNLQGGALWYSTDDGGTWTSVGDVSATSPLPLAADATTRIYYRPAREFYGTISDVIHFKAWDRNLSWQQFGADIDGASPGDQSGATPPQTTREAYGGGNYGTILPGKSTSLSADGTVVAIGGHFNDQNGDKSGHVRVFRRSVSGWQQLGNDLVGGNPGDEFGFAVSLSDDGNVLAVGAPGNHSVKGDRVGTVSIYDWSGSTWELRGQLTGFFQFGRTVELSNDGTYIGVGQFRVYSSSDDVSAAYVFRWTGAEYELMYSFSPKYPNQMNGVGSSIAISSDAQRIVVGAYVDGPSEVTRGYGAARFYRWFGSAIGLSEYPAAVYGSLPNENLGSSVSLGGGYVAVGSPGWTQSPSDTRRRGRVRILDADGQQVGGDITHGGATPREFGSSVSLSDDGRTVAVGAPAYQNGQASVYSWSGSDWVQIGATLVGKGSGDRFGQAVELAASGRTLAVAAPLNDGENGIDSGSVRVFDFGLSLSKTVDTVSIYVEGVNNAPTIDAIGDLTIRENATERAINLSGISAGSGESQALNVTATSTNTGLIPDPTVIYSSPDATGSLKLTPVADQSGTAKVIVLVEDGGLDNDLATPGDNATVARTFEVFVNATPTLDAIEGVTHNEDIAEHSVSLSGIGAGASESQPLRVTASSSNTELIPDPTITYTSADSTGTLAYTPLADQSGTATITVMVEDGGKDGDLATVADNNAVSRTFEVTIAAVNDDPTLNELADLTLEDQSFSDVTVQLAGITAGGGESQPLRVAAASSNTGSIDVTGVSYTSAEATGSIILSVAPEASGNATISVTVEDGGLDNDLQTSADNATFTRTFVVAIEAVQPVITGPLGNTEDQRPRINWTPVSAAVSYRIWIGHNSQGTNPYIRGVSAETFFDVPKDLGNGKIDVWVQGVRDNGQLLPWSKMHRFVIGAAPIVEDLPDRQTTARPVVKWSAVPGAASYDVYVNNVSSGQQEYVRTTVTSTEWSPEEDLPLSRYHIWVSAIAADGLRGPWSVRENFYVVPAPEILSPVLPTFDRTPTFDFTDVTGATSYGVFLRYLVDGSVTADLKGLPTSEWTPDTDLAPGRYAWWAIADSAVAGFRSAWTPRQEFFVGGLTTITSPVSPAASTTPLIEWEAVSGASHYILQVNGEVEGPKLIYRDDLTTNSLQVETPLTSGRIYRLWVKAVSTTGEHGPWTDAYVFTVAASQIDQSQEVLPNNVLALLDQNPLVTSREVVPERPVSRTVPDGRALAADQKRAVEIDVSVTPMDSREPAAEFVPDDNFAGGALLSRVLPRDWFEQVAEALEI